MGSYYGSLAYADLRKELQVTKRFEQEYMEVMAESFCRGALELSHVVTNSKS